MYSLWIVQWDFTRRDHLENPGRVSGSSLIIKAAKGELRIVKAGQQADKEEL